jgi:hypothetical protein
MADDQATRNRRWRAHKAGDHSLCRPGRCPAAAERVRGRVAARVAARPAGGEPVDRAGMLDQLLLQLWDLVQAEPGNVAAARELHRQLLAGGGADAEPDPVAQRVAVVGARRAVAAAGGNPGAAYPGAGADFGHMVRPRLREVTDDE